MGDCGKCREINVTRLEPIYRNSFFKMASFLSPFVRLSVGDGAGGAPPAGPVSSVTRPRRHTGDDITARTPTRVEEGGEGGRWGRGDGAMPPWQSGLRGPRYL